MECVFILLNCQDQSFQWDEEEAANEITLPPSWQLRPHPRLIATFGTALPECLLFIRGTEKEEEVEQLRAQTPEWTQNAERERENNPKRTLQGDVDTSQQCEQSNLGKSRCENFATTPQTLKIRTLLRGKVALSSVLASHFELASDSRKRGAIKPDLFVRKCSMSDIPCFPTWNCQTSWFSKMN